MTEPRRSRIVSGPVSLALVFRMSAVTCTVESARRSCGSSASSVTVTGSTGAAVAGAAVAGAAVAGAAVAGAANGRPAASATAATSAVPSRRTRSDTVEQLRGAGHQGPLVLVRQGAGELVQRHPGDGADLDVGVGELTALGPQQEVVHGLVHPPPVGHEPEVDRAQPADDPPGDAGLLGDVADGPCRRS